MKKADRLISLAEAPRRAECLSGWGLEEVGLGQVAQQTGGDTC